MELTFCHNFTLVVTNKPVRFKCVIPNEPGLSGVLPFLEAPRGFILWKWQSQNVVPSLPTKKHMSNSIWIISALKRNHRIHAVRQNNCICSDLLRIPCTLRTRIGIILTVHPGKIQNLLVWLNTTTTFFETCRYSDVMLLMYMLYPNVSAGIVVFFITTWQHQRLVCDGSNLNKPTRCVKRLHDHASNVLVFVSMQLLKELSNPCSLGGTMVISWRFPVTKHYGRFLSHSAKHMHWSHKLNFRFWAVVAVCVQRHAPQRWRAQNRSFLLLFKFKFGYVFRQISRKWLKLETVLDFVDRTLLDYPWRASSAHRA